MNIFTKIEPYAAKLSSLPRIFVGFSNRHYIEKNFPKDFTRKDYANFIHLSKKMSSSRIFWRINLKPPGKLAAGASSLTRLLEIPALCHNARPWYPLPLGNRHLNFAGTSSPLPLSRPGTVAETNLAFQERREGRFFTNFSFARRLRFFI